MCRQKLQGTAARDEPSIAFCQFFEHTSGISFCSPRRRRRPHSPRTRTPAPPCPRTPGRGRTGARTASRRPGTSCSWRATPSCSASSPGACTARPRRSRMCTFGRPGRKGPATRGVTLSAFSRVWGRTRCTRGRAASRRGSPSRPSGRSRRGLSACMCCTRIFHTWMAPRRPRQLGLSRRSEDVFRSFWACPAGLSWNSCGELYTTPIRSCAARIQKTSGRRGS